MNRAQRIVEHDYGAGPCETFDIGDNLRGRDVAAVVACHEVIHYYPVGIPEVSDLS